MYHAIQKGESKRGEDEKVQVPREEIVHVRPPQSFALPITFVLRFDAEAVVALRIVEPSLDDAGGLWFIAHTKGVLRCR